MHYPSKLQHHSYPIASLHHGPPITPVVATPVAASPTSPSQPPLRENAGSSQAELGTEDGGLPDHLKIVIPALSSMGGLTLLALLGRYYQKRSKEKAQRAQTSIEYVQRV